MADGFTGMSEFVADLRALGPSLQREGDAIASKHAEAAAQATRAGYAVRSGRLRNGVRVERLRLGAYQVKSRARHAHLYEDGTERRFLNSNGAPRGAMPERPTMIPAAIRWRARMREQLIGLVKRTRIRGMTGTLDVVERRGD